MKLRVAGVVVGGIAVLPLSADGLILRNSKESLNVEVDPSVASDLWNVTRVGVDADVVKSEYTAAKDSGALRADGYMPTGCFPDRNLKTRDLHGSETSYEGPISVIKYENVIGKTEQEPMTQKVCYEFCRRFEQVKFFAITNGSKCYCEPMFNVATVGDKNGGCRTPCEGNPGEMCGGPDMSSVFEMHDAPPKQKFSTENITNFNFIRTSIADLGVTTKMCADNLVKAGSKLVETQKQKGNTVSMPHQQAMTEAYQTLIADMNALPFEAAKLASDLETALGAFSSLGSDAGEAAVETAMTAVELASEAAKTAIPALASVYKECHPNITSTGEALPFFTTISSGTSAQSCKGKVIGTPFVTSGSEPEDACAQKCQNTLAPEPCVGFQVYKGLLAKYEGPGWKEVELLETETRSGWSHFICAGFMTRWTYPDGRVDETDMTGLTRRESYCSCPPGGKCFVSTGKEQVTSGGEVCMLFSDISGVTQYNKADCEASTSPSGPVEGKCFVPKTELSSHSLHTKSDTVTLPYCFHGDV